MCCIFENTRWTETGTRAKTRRRAAYLSLRGVWNFNKYLAQACQNRQRRERDYSRKRDRRDRDKTQDTFVWWCLTKGWIVINKYKMEQTDPDVTKMKIQQILYLCLWKGRMIAHMSIIFAQHALVLSTKKS